MLIFCLVFGTCVPLNAISLAWIFCISSYDLAETLSVHDQQLRGVLVQTHGGPCRQMASFLDAFLDASGYIFSVIFGVVGMSFLVLFPTW